MQCYILIMNPNLIVAKLMLYKHLSNNQGNAIVENPEQSVLLSQDTVHIGFFTGH